MVNNYISGIISSVIVCYSLISGCKCSVRIARYAYQCVVRNIVVCSCIRKSKLVGSVQSCIRYKRSCCSVYIVMYRNITCIISSILVCYNRCSCCRICSCMACRCSIYYCIVRYAYRICSICKSRLSDTAKILIIS